MKENYSELWLLSEDWSSELPKGIYTVSQIYSRGYLHPEEWYEGNREMWEKITLEDYIV